MIPATARTRLIALLGDPVAHSLSPILQNAAHEAAGVDGVYVALRCDAARFEGLVRGIIGAGGAGNVTIPHKELAARLVENPTPAVSATGACNTLWGEGGRLCGDNTDVGGFAAAARALVGSPAGARVLLLGAGGAARAALCALLQEHADAVLVHARTPQRAVALRDAFGTAARRVRVVEGERELRRDGFDLVVNATPLGLEPDDPPPFPLDSLHRVGAVLDMVYTPAETAWVRRARAMGITAADGLEMLVQQGARSFERWWGAPAPIEAMQAAAAALRTLPA